MAGLLAVRIKDGLFVGNSISSQVFPRIVTVASRVSLHLSPTNRLLQDDEFLFLNKVSHIVNCAATETPNLYQQAGINYLSFPWRDAPTTTLFDNEVRLVSLGGGGGGGAPHTYGTDPKPPAASRNVPPIEATTSL